MCPLLLPVPPEIQQGTGVWRSEGQIEQLAFVLVKQSSLTPTISVTYIAKFPLTYWFV